MYGEHKAENGKILRELWDWKGIRRVEAEVQSRERENPAGIMGLEGNPQSRGRSVSGAYPYAGRNPTERKCRRIYGITQRKEQYPDSRKTRKSEIQIWEPEFLVPGISWTQQERTRKR